MFRSLFGKPNPTRDWPSADRRDLVLNADRFELNGVPVGQPLERLMFLGPDQGGSTHKSGELQYHSLGFCLEFEVADGRIKTYQAVFRDPDEPAFAPFAGRVECSGSALDVKSMKVEDLDASLGEPYWIDRDDGETLVFYEFSNQREWQLEFQNNKLYRFIITSDAVMADPDQRAAYGVEKPWP